MRKRQRGMRRVLPKVKDQKEGEKKHVAIIFCILSTDIVDVVMRFHLTIFPRSLILLI